MAQNNSFSINLDLDKQKVEEGLKSLGNTIDKNLTNKKLSIQVDEEKLNQQMKAVEAKLKSIENKKIKMDIDDKVVDDQINNLKSKIESIETSKIKAGFDSESAAKEVALLQKDIDKLLSKKSKIAINVSDAEAEIASLSNMMSGLQDEKAKITVDVDDSDVRDLEESIDNIDDKSVKVTGSADASEVKDFADEIDDLPDDKVVKVSLEGTMTEAFNKAKALGELGDSLGEIAEKGNEYRSAMKQIELTSGATGLALENLKNSAETLFVKGVGESVADATQKMLLARKVLGDTASLEDVEALAKRAEGISKATGASYEEIVGNSAQIMKNYGASVDEATNALANLNSNISESKDASGALEEFSTEYASAGYSIEDTSNMLINADKNGLDKLGKMGDAIREQRIKLMDGSLITETKAIKSPISAEVEETQKQLQNGIINRQEYNEKLIKLMEDPRLTDKQKAAYAKANFGTIGEDMGNQIWANMSTKPAEEAGKNQAEAMAKALEPKNVFAKFAKGMEVEFGKITSSLSPMLSGISSALTQVSQVAPGIKLLSEFDMKKSIAGMKDFATGIAQGAKQLLTVLVPSLGAATVSQEGLNIAQSANPMGAIILAVILLGSAFLILYEKVEPFKNFIDGIGAWFSDAIGGVMVALQPLGKAFESYGGLILTYFTTPFKILWNIIKAIFGDFSEGAKSTKTFGDSIAALKPTIQAISDAVSYVFKFISKAIEMFGDWVTKKLVGAIKDAKNIFNDIGEWFKKIGNYISDFFAPKIKTVVDFFTEMGDTIKYYLGPVFTWLQNLIQPIIDTIMGAYTETKNFVNSMVGMVSDKMAADEKKAYENSMGNMKKYRNELENLDAIAFGANTWNDATKKKKLEELDILKKNADAAAKQLQNEKDVQKQLEYNAKLDSNIRRRIGAVATTNELTEEQKKQMEAEAKAKSDADKAKAAEAQKLRNDALRAEQIHAARLIANEWDKELKILSINEEFDLKNLALEKKSQAEIAKVKAKYAQDKSLINEKYRLKEFETAISDAKTNAKELVEASQIVIDEYKIQLNSGDTSVLPAYMAESFKKLNSEHDAQIQEYLDKDKEFIEKQKEIALRVSTGEITQDEGLKELEEFAKKRLELMKFNNISYQNLLKKQYKENKELIKSLKKDELSSQYADQLENAKSAAEYDKIQSLKSLKEKYDADVAAANKNKTKILSITKTFWQETAKIESAYREANLSNSLKVYSKIANSLVGIFSNIKIGNNKEEIDAAKSDLASIEQALKELDAQKLENSISETEYEIKSDELLRKKQDALDRAGQSYVTFGNIVRAVNQSITESMAKMVDESIVKNTELLNRMAETEAAKQEIRAKGNAASTEDIEALAALTEDSEKFKQEAYLNTASVFAGTMSGMMASGKSFLKSSIMAILAASKVIIAFYIAQTYASEISSKSFAGLITAPLLSAVFIALLSAAESAVGSMDFFVGGLAPGVFGEGLHTREKSVKMRISEVEGMRKEFVFNPYVTSKSDIDELNAINKMRISPKEYYSRQLGVPASNGIIDLSLIHQDNLITHEILRNAKLIDQKVEVYNNVTAKVEVPNQPSYLSY